ncbi:MAG: NUDIX hydrolase [Eggerthella lenta]
MNAWRLGEMLEVPMSEQLARAYEGFCAAGTAPAVPRLAATVMLVRSPREVFMLRRAATMAFVPEAVVFPGGGVDPADDGARCSWIGPDEEVWARRMGTSADVARRVVTAAARELFEECGVLLAGDERGVCSLDASEPAWAEERPVPRDLVADAEAPRLALRADLLFAFALATPEFERPLDTYFAALRPTGYAPARPIVPDGWTAGWRPRRAGQCSWCGRRRTPHAPGVESFAAGVEETGRVMLEPAVREGGRAVLTCRLP